MKVGFEYNTIISDAAANLHQQTPCMSNGIKFV